MQITEPIIPTPNAESLNRNPEPLKFRSVGHAQAVFDIDSSTDNVKGWFVRQYLTYLDQSDAAWSNTRDFTEDLDVDDEMLSSPRISGLCKGFEAKAPPHTRAPALTVAEVKFLEAFASSGETAQDVVTAGAVLFSFSAVPVLAMQYELFPWKWISPTHQFPPCGLKVQLRSARPLWGRAQDWCYPCWRRASTSTPQG